MNDRPSNEWSTHVDPTWGEVEESNLKDVMPSARVVEPSTFTLTTIQTVLTKKTDKTLLV